MYFTFGSVLNSGPTAKHTISTKALDIKANICVFPPTPSNIAERERATHAGKPLKIDETILPTA